MTARAAFRNASGRIEFPPDYDESCYCHLHEGEPWWQSDNSPMNNSCDAAECINRTARAEHAPHMAVPLGVVPRRDRGTVAAAHPTPASRAGGGMSTGRACVSPTARPAAPAPVSSAGAGAQIGPAGTRIPSPWNPRPGHHGGTA